MERFVASSVQPMAVRPADSHVLDISFSVRQLGQPEEIVLDHDPFVERPLKAARFAVNGIAVFMLVLAAGLTTLAVVPRLFGNDAVVVVSRSMEPSIRVSDVVIISESDGIGLGAGSVIHYEYDDSYRLHRISAAHTDGYETRGDANSLADSELVRPEDIKGVGVVVVPMVGLPNLWVDEQRWLHLAAAVVGLVAVAYAARPAMVGDQRLRRKR